MQSLIWAGARFKVFFFYSYITLYIYNYIYIYLLFAVWWYVSTSGFSNTRAAIHGLISRAFFFDLMVFEASDLIALAGVPSFLGMHCSVRLNIIVMVSSFNVKSMLKPQVVHYLFIAFCSMTGKVLRYTTYYNSQSRDWPIFVGTPGTDTSTSTTKSHNISSPPKQ